MCKCLLQYVTSSGTQYIRSYVTFLTFYIDERNSTQASIATDITTQDIVQSTPLERVHKTLPKIPFKTHQILTVRLWWPFKTHQL